MPIHGSESRIESGVHLRYGFNHVFIDTQIRHQLGRHVTITAQCINLHRAVSAEHHSALVVMKLVSLCMAAKVIMIVEPTFTLAFAIILVFILAMGLKFRSAHSNPASLETSAL